MTALHSVGGNGNGDGHSADSDDWRVSAEKRQVATAEAIIETAAGLRLVKVAAESAAREATAANAGVKRVEGQITDLRAALMIEFAKLSKSDSQHRAKLDSFSTEIAETRQALTGLKLFGVWIDRHKATAEKVVKIAAYLLVSIASALVTAAQVAAKLKGHWLCPTLPTSTSTLLTSA